MNNIQARVLATGLIWTALTVLGVAAMVTGASSQSFILFVMIAGATIATGTIWRWADGSSVSDVEAEKVKRRTRVERLVENLDERELEELRHRLRGEEDDERYPLEELVRTGSRE